MWGLVAALAALAALLGAAASRPARERAREMRVLARARDALLRGRVTLDLAENALVLARRHKQVELEAELRRKIASMKKQGGK